MLLATKCPHCRTTFKVANDQLKLQAGLVRCGICQQVFNGIEHLVGNEEAEKEVVQPEMATITETAESSEMSHTVTTVSIEPNEIELDFVLDMNESELESAPVTKEEEFVPLQTDEVITTENEHSDENAPDNDDTIDFDSLVVGKPIGTPEPVATETSETAEAVQKEDPPTEVDNNSANIVETKDADSIEDLSFIRQAKTKRLFAWLLSIGTLLLLLTLVGQTAYAFRNLIAAAYPASKPALTKLCQFARCQIQLPAQLSELSYEADELHTLPRPNAFEFGLLMHNRSDLTQAWPSIELTLKNVQKQVVLRRVFTPAEYLSNPADVSLGFPPNQEQAVKLYFEVNDLRASDYVVAIFYP